jgi:hypothetical protein
MPKERIHPQKELPIGGSFIDDEEDDTTAGMVTVLHAPYMEDLPVGEMSVHQIRERFFDRLDIHPEAVAFVDGNEADGDTVVHEGQRLMFMRASGEKGVRSSAEVVTVRGEEIVATLPEGSQKKMKLADVLQKMSPQVPDTCGAILPDGVKTAIPYAGGVILVHQTPPQVYSFRWIADGSAAEYGPGTSYRTVRLALPYVIVVAVYEGTRRLVPQLSQRSECFFSNEPLEKKRFDTPMSYPALLNCSKIPDDGVHALSWICTQHLPPSEFRGRKTLDAALSDGLGALLRHLLESGFNRSSEVHEGESGFGATVKAAIDPRIANVESWEKASADNPLFALDVPWLPTGKTLGQVTARIGRPGRGRSFTFKSAGDIARLMFKPASQGAPIQ